MMEPSAPLSAEQELAAQKHQLFLSIDEQCRAIIMNRKHERNKLRSKFRGAQALGRRNSRISPELPAPNELYLDQLREVTRQIPPDWLWANYIHIDLAMVHLYFANGQYECVHQAIQLMAHKVPAKLESDIEDFWYNAAYYRLPLAKEAKQRKSYKHCLSPDQMSPVNRYRVRKKFPCPTVQRCGGKKYKVSSATKQLLLSYFANNPRPCKNEKLALAEQTGLSPETISNWFKNRRQRSKIGGNQENFYEQPQMAYMFPAESPASSGYCSSTASTSTQFDYYQQLPVVQEQQQQPEQHMYEQPPTQDQIPFLDEDLISAADLAAQLETKQDALMSNGLETGQQLAYERYPTAFTFSPDEYYLNNYHSPSYYC